MALGISLLKPLGYQRNTTCGYCKTTAGSSSYYLACDNMRVDHYQELMDRGWRRSGTTYYKPDLPRSCCPHYTIRLEASDFKPKRGQRKAIHRWNEHVLGALYKRKAAMLCPQSREQKRQTRDRFDLITAIHKTEYCNVQRPVLRKSQLAIEPAHKFEVNLEAAKFTKEKHNVFLEYQTQIHRDPRSRWGEESFKRFLCHGIDTQSFDINSQKLKVGSYHQCYRLDGRLVAVGVLDLLPHAVSSVYLFYDPEFHDWEFGKISAMREIALAIECNYKWYYMGYYIHSCTKMRYKGTFEPSYLLDPESLGWNRLDDRLRRWLDQHKYVCPSRDEKFGDDELSQEQKGSGTESHEPPPSPDTNDFDVDSDPSEADETEIPEGSLFEYHIPGVLTKEEVSALDLGHWKLLIRSSLVDFEDLVGWEDQQVDDPTCVKGIVAELAAATGPKLLRNSAVKLF